MHSNDDIVINCEGRNEMRKKQMLKRAAAVILSAAMAVGVVISMPSLPAEAKSSGRVPMYRLYNPNTGEHHYTPSASERDNISRAGWNYEGVGWYAPESSNTPVYRLYNPNTGDHHYSMDKTEKNICVRAGWQDADIAWYSDDAKTVAVYREFNPNAVTGTHNYTSNLNEHNYLGSIGWSAEGIAWYGLEPRDEDSWKSAYSAFVNSYDESGSVNGSTIEQVTYRALYADYDNLVPILVVNRINGYGANISLYIYDNGQVQPVKCLEDVASYGDIDGTTIYFDPSDGSIIILTTGNYYNGQSYVKMRRYRLNLTAAKKIDSSASDFYTMDPYEYLYVYIEGNYHKTGYFMVYDNGSEKEISKSEFEKLLQVSEKDGSDVTGKGQEKSSFTTDIAQAEGNYKVGDTVILGSYEQDNNLSNGKEPIEWQVIGSRNGHTLLLSKYALDCKKYNETYTDITWENCTLRSWLNNDFYNTAFSSSDKKRIVTAHNENPDSYELYKPWNYGSSVYGAEGGNATDDKVFLLSWTEARDYLDGKLYEDRLGAGNYNQKLLCRPTAYAKAQGVGTWTYSNSDNYGPSDIDGCCWWWLRSPGPLQHFAATVIIDGSLGNYGSVGDSGEGVRPALLID